MIFKHTLTFCFLLVLTLPAKSQLTCGSEDSQQLDFLIGDWELFNKNGEVIGENSIKLVFGTCTIEENYKGNDGLKSHSVFNYDHINKRWSQAWSDDFGNSLNYSGTFKNNKLTLKATSLNAANEQVYHRVIYAKQTNGTVSQTWQKSTNNKEWTTTYSGTYKRKKAVL